MRGYISDRACGRNDEGLYRMLADLITSDVRLTIGATQGGKPVPEMPDGVKAYRATDLLTY